MFPFDDVVAIHIIIGYVGFALAWTHALLHVVDFKNASDPSRRHLWDAAFPAYHQPSSMEIWMTQEAVTGIGMLVIFTIAFLFASPWPRNSRILKKTWIGKVPRCHIVKHSDFIHDDHIDKNSVFMLQVLNDFKFFWYTHHLFSLFYLFLFLHPWPALPDESNEWGKSDAWAWVGK